MGIESKLGGLLSEETAPDRAYEPIQVFRQPNTDFGGKERFDVHGRLPLPVATAPPLPLTAPQARAASKDGWTHGPSASRCCRMGHRRSSRSFGPSYPKQARNRATGSGKQGVLCLDERTAASLRGNRKQSPTLSQPREWRPVRRRSGPATAGLYGKASRRYSTNGANRNPLLSYRYFFGSANTMYEFIGGVAPGGTRGDW